MNAFEFGGYVAEKMAYGGAASFVGRPPAAPTAPTPPKAPAYKPAAGTPSLLTNMGNNSARVGGGILSTVAGGIGTGLTGLAAGANHAWNAATPKSMNTSQGYTQGVNQVFDKAKNFTAAGAKDVYGGLGGDTNYGTQHAWNELQKGWNDPNVDATTRSVAQTAAYTGHGAWNAAQIVANPGKILANAPRAGLDPRTWAAAGSRIIPGARGGIQTANTAHRATPALGAVGKAVDMADTGAALGIDLPNAVGGVMTGIKNKLYAPTQATTAQSAPPQSTNYWNPAAGYNAAQGTLDALRGDVSRYSPYVNPAYVN